MSTIIKLFSYYSKVLKKISTIIGVIAIYIFGISLGRLFYSFSKKDKRNKWSDYQTGASPENMY